MLSAISSAMGIFVWCDPIRGWWGTVRLWRNLLRHSWMSFGLFSIVLITWCKTKTATGAKKLVSLTTFTNNICIKVSDRDQHLKLWWNVLPCILRLIISVITFSANGEEALLLLVAAQHLMAKTSQMVSSTRIPEILLISTRWTS